MLVTLYYLRCDAPSRNGGVDVGQIARDVLRQTRRPHIRTEGRVLRQFDDGDVVSKVAAAVRAVDGDAGCLDAVSKKEISNLRTQICCFYFELGH